MRKERLISLRLVSTTVDGRSPLEGVIQETSATVVVEQPVSRLSNLRGMAKNGLKWNPIETREE